MATNPKTGYRKHRIGDPVRRQLALRYGCPPGGSVKAPCHYCSALALVEWPRRRDGMPGYMVWFGHEIDHIVPEFLGGPGEVDNLVLACRPCNRRKGWRV